MSRVLVHWILALISGSQAVAISAQTASETSESAAKNFDGFAATRSEIQTLIGSATSRIHIATDFLSDGEIVTALYIAQYRKVNVQVLLGQGRATSPLSRLNYLKAQNIPVWLRPGRFYSQHPTIMLIDDQLYSLNAELDYMARHRKFTLTMLGTDQIAKFDEAFTNATNTGVSPNPRSTPLVGKGHHEGRVFTKQESAPTGNVTTSPTPTPSFPKSAGSTSSDGSYRYRSVKENPGHGVPTKLPKTPVWQERAKERDALEKIDHGGPTDNGTTVQ